MGQRANQHLRCAIEAASRDRRAEAEQQIHEARKQGANITAALTYVSPANWPESKGELLRTLYAALSEGSR